MHQEKREQYMKLLEKKRRLVECILHANDFQSPAELRANAAQKRARNVIEHLVERRPNKNARTAAQQRADAAQKRADAAQKRADAAQKRADAAQKR